MPEQLAERSQLHRVVDPPGLSALRAPPGRVRRHRQPRRSAAGRRGRDRQVRQDRRAAGRRLRRHRARPGPGRARWPQPDGQLLRAGGRRSRRSRHLAARGQHVDRSGPVDPVSRRAARQRRKRAHRARHWSAAHARWSTASKPPASRTPPSPRAPPASSSAATRTRCSSGSSPSSRPANGCAAANSTAGRGRGR